MRAIRHDVRCSPRNAWCRWLGSGLGHGGSEHVRAEGPALSAYVVGGASYVLTCWTIGAG